MTRLLEKCDERNHGQKKKQKKNKKSKKSLKRNPEAKCMVCTWLKNTDEEIKLHEAVLSKNDISDNSETFLRP